MQTVEDLPEERARDEALVARFRRGDAAAFDVIVRRHRREVYVVARRILGSHEDADEKLQPRVRAMERERSRSRRERKSTVVELRRAYRQGVSDAEPSNPGPP